MAQTAVLTLLIGLVFTFFSGAVQTRLRGGFKRRPVLVWLLPVVLTTIFTKAALVAGVRSLPLSAAMLAYTVSPTLCAFLQGTEAKGKPGALDFGAILLLWLPLEFAAGARLVPRPAQGYLHSVAYGIAILLGLVLFLAFRSFPDLKFNLPRKRADGWLPVAGFVAVAPILIGLGIAIGFIPMPHWPVKTGGAMTAAAGMILIGTALPEEIL